MLFIRSLDSARPCLYHSALTLPSACREALTDGVQPRSNAGQQMQASPHMLTSLQTRVARCVSFCMSEQDLCLSKFACMPLAFARPCPGDPA